MYDMFTLPNGLRVIGERIPHFRSVSVGMWIGAGSQFETYAQAGVSHFIEHMVFKGTAKRSAFMIATEMDEVGGQLNAFTSKECTCFYAKVIDERLELAMDVLSDLVTAPAFDATEMQKEKGVVLEEISMSEDTPEDVAHELIMLAKFGDQPIARPILGHAKSVSAFSREDLLNYWHAMYRPENAVLALAGNYELDRVKELADKYLAQWRAEGLAKPEVVTHAVAPTVLTREKDIEQAHICLGFPGVRADSDENYACSLINTVYGGAMSSRLFQRIREQSGLAYSVYSYPNSYTDCGMISVYAATNPGSARAVYDMLIEETNKLANDGLTNDEFRMAREQLKASFILGLESTSARMTSIGRRLLLFNSTRTQQEVIDKIEAITHEAANALITDLLKAPHAIALVGKNAEDLLEN